MLTDPLVFGSSHEVSNLLALLLSYLIVFVTPLSLSDEQVMLLLDFWEVEGISHIGKVKEIELDCKNKVIKNKGFCSGEE